MPNMELCDLKTTKPPYKGKWPTSSQISWSPPLLLFCSSLLQGLWYWRHGISEINIAQNQRIKLIFCLLTESFSFTSSGDKDKNLNAHYMHLLTSVFLSCCHLPIIFNIEHSVWSRHCWQGTAIDEWNRHALTSHQYSKKLKGKFLALLL